MAELELGKYYQYVLEGNLVFAVDTTGNKILIGEVEERDERETDD